MQDRYVGDAGDFGKYGLLRALIKSSELKLGVVWCFVKDESHNEDGKHTTYLNQITFRGCDGELYDRLKQITLKKKRRLSAIERSKIFPPETVFYRKELNRRDRGEWLSNAVQQTSSCDIIFLDPDNGIALEDSGAYRSLSPKHILIKDLDRFFVGQKTLVVYHHLGRNGKHADQIKRYASEIQNRLKSEPISLRYCRGTSRVFFIIPSPAHREEIIKRVEDFMDYNWKEHFIKH
ncbi:MAG: hypothetical protein HYZ84_07520 [Candidatus Omnitrophica bacterium]|nr:hypothetical protein [Candidatus Omnitrophota bacterium]